MLSFPGNPASIVDPALISSAHPTTLSSLCHPHGSISTNEDLAEVLHESDTMCRCPKYSILDRHMELQIYSSLGYLFCEFPQMWLH